MEGITTRREGRPAAAAALALSSWVLAVLAVVALVAASPPVDANLWFFAVDVAVAAVYGTVGGLILARRRHPVPWVLALAALGGGLAAAGYAYGELDATVGALPGVGVVAPLQGIAWVPGTLALFLVVPWLVRDRPLGPAWWGVAAGAALSLVLTTTRLMAFRDHDRLVFALIVAVGLAAAAEVCWRLRRGPQAERQGLGWLALGTAVMALSYVPLVSATGFGLPVWVTPSLHLAASAVFPAAVLVVVLRQRLWGLDLAVSRAVVAGALTVGLVALYVAVTTALTGLLPGQGAAQVVAAAVVAVAVQPSRLWLQRRVHRLVYGEGAEPDRAVRRLGRQLGTARTAEELLAGLVETVGAGLRLESAVLCVDGRTAAAWGTATSPPRAVPLEHQGQEVGELLVTVPPGESLDARATRTLLELAAVVSAGVALVRATEQVERARDRLTSVRLEERRVLRRELHDGLGPALAGLRLGLQGARNLVGTDPALAGQLLAALQEELDQRVDDVRALSRSLLPPALEELGLGAALAELAARHGEAGLEVAVGCQGAEELEPHLAAAAYGIAVEAVTNTARHAGASRCTVDVGVDDGVLRVVVEDDGCGRPDGVRAGVGTRTMHERAEEQGGRLVISAAEPAGTRVEAVLPLTGATGATGAGGAAGGRLPGPRAAETVP